MEKKSSPQNRLQSLFNKLKRTVRIPYKRAIHLRKWAASRTITRQTMIQGVPNTSWKPRNPLPNPPHTHTLQVLLLVFFGAFAKLRKAPLRFMSVRPSVRMEQPGSHWKNFSWNLIFEYFSKICRENSGFIKIGQDLRVHTLRPIYIFDHISLSSYWNKKCLR